MTGIGGIDLNLLITLGALLEERNLTRAGEKISMSQPTMSGALARLRLHFGDELLVRSGRHYVLTPTAERLLPAVQEALRQVERTLEVAPEFCPAASARQFSLALSDYAVTVLIEPLLRRVHELAPGVGLELSPIPADMQESDRGLLQHDLVIGPLGFRFLGRSEVVFRDRFVCIMDPGNPRLRDGRLSLADLGELPHASATFGHAGLNPAERALDELGVHRNVQVTTVGWLSLPFVVAGTDLVAVVPERLARRVVAAAGVAVAEPPFGRVELVEAAWWHPMRTADPALAWLRGILADVAESLQPDTRDTEEQFPLEVGGT
ncbi:MAG TPA: LysR family transcriptional regulator [Streptosporangiaceae bacterium]|nr:LysR family transcriptional regulator [Streptosporangiaceae bacterium]